MERSKFSRRAWFYVLVTVISTAGLILSLKDGQFGWLSVVLHVAVPVLGVVCIVEELQRRPNA